MFEFALGMEVRFSKYSRTESSIANSNSNINTRSWQGLKKYQSGNTLMLLILIKLLNCFLSNSYKKTSKTKSFLRFSSFSRLIIISMTLYQMSGDYGMPPRHQYDAGPPTAPPPHAAPRFN